MMLLDGLTHSHSLNPLGQLDYHLFHLQNGIQSFQGSVTVRTALGFRESAYNYSHSSDEGAELKFQGNDLLYCYTAESPSPA